jgi:hypothetical protein
MPGIQAALASKKNMLDERLFFINPPSVYP